MTTYGESFALSLALRLPVPSPKARFMQPDDGQLLLSVRKAAERL